MTDFPSITEFSEMSEKDRQMTIYRISLSNHIMIKEHAPVVTRILGYEKKGNDAMKWSMRIIIGILIAAFTVWLNNNFGNK